MLQNFDATNLPSLRIETAALKCFLNVGNSGLILAKNWLTVTLLRPGGEPKCRAENALLGGLKKSNL